MPEKIVVGIGFLVFLVIRLAWPRGKDKRMGFHMGRELLTSSIFTFSLLGIYIAYLTSTVLDFASFALPVFLQGLGILLILGALFLLQRVHRALGEFFSPHLELKDSHRIVSQGPYLYIRHPMYTSGVLYLLGSGLVARNVLLLGVPLAAFLLLLSLRVRDEEKMMADRFGEEWTAHVARTGLLWPKIR